MKGLIFYRILTLIVNVFCTMIGMTLVLLLAVVIANPQFAILFFIFLCIILYAWHANRFLLIVLIKNQPTTKKHKDWLQVNAIVTFLVCVFVIGAFIFFKMNPHFYQERLKQLPSELQTSMDKGTPIGAVLYLLLLLHVIWTYTLIRKHKDSFIEEQP